MLNVKPKKHLGQHFLTDLVTAGKITDLLHTDPALPAYEIGPGKGVLTRLLLPRIPELHLLEIDTESIEYLNVHFARQGLHIHHADVLQWDFAQTPGEFRVIGNLPYNITSPIFFRLLEFRENFREGVFMIQKEVADRICTPPGKRECGILSVLISAWYEPKYHLTVQPGAFFPPPKVKSAVISLTRKKNPPDIDFSTFLMLVKKAFGQRRKMLRNALSGLELRPSAELDELLNKRAEQLSLEQFFWLEKQLI